MWLHRRAECAKLRVRWWAPPKDSVGRRSGCVPLRAFVLDAWAEGWETLSNLFPHNLVSLVVGYYGDSCHERAIQEHAWLALDIPAILGPDQNFFERVRVRMTLDTKKSIARLFDPIMLTFLVGLCWWGHYLVEDDEILNTWTNYGAEFGNADFLLRLLNDPLDTHHFREGDITKALENGHTALVTELWPYFEHSYQTRRVPTKVVEHCARHCTKDIVDFCCTEMTAWSGVDEDVKAEVRNHAYVIAINESMRSGRIDMVRHCAGRCTKLDLRALVNMALKEENGPSARSLVESGLVTARAMFTVANSRGYYYLAKRVFRVEWDFVDGVLCPVHIELRPQDLENKDPEQEHDQQHDQHVDDAWSATAPLSHRSPGAPRQSPLSKGGRY